VTPARFADREFTLPQQTAAPSYQEGQRRPGDYEAKVSQRPIAIHGLEHLGATDRGISMFRKLVQQGIRTVRDGGEPKGVSHLDDGPIPTYCNDTVVRTPAAESPEADAQMMRETGRRLAESYLHGNRR
jgi:hypothetical protein